jgi:hypothetical protein
MSCVQTWAALQHVAHEAFDSQYVLVVSTIRLSALHASPTLSAQRGSCSQHAAQFVPSQKATLVCTWPAAASHVHGVAGWQHCATQPL